MWENQGVSNVFFTYFDCFLGGGGQYKLGGSRGTRGGVKPPPPPTKRALDKWLLAACPQLLFRKSVVSGIEPATLRSLDQVFNPTTIDPPNVLSSLFNVLCIRNNSCRVSICDRINKKLSHMAAQKTLSSSVWCMNSELPKLPSSHIYHSSVAPFSFATTYK